EIQGFDKMLKKDVISLIDKFSKFEFVSFGKVIQIQSISTAKELKQKYTFDQENDVIIDNETGVNFTPVNGTFTSSTGEELIPGFKVNIGLTNYKRFITNKGYRKPTASIIVWNLAFSFFSVTISFFLGLLIALVFDKLPGRGIIRTLLIIPYPIPVLVSITVWKGLLNESMGLITNVLQNIFGASPQFFSDKNWARIALVLINVYLSYPYFYILASGAIRSIPGDILEAAEIDGANNFIKLKAIILPLILKILAPLLIASFSFNFNNFTLIWGFNAGLPAMADTIVPMGYTDLLISFVYRLGFSTANAANYGFAAAITVLLFLFVSAMVFLQIKSTNALKEEK
ncbi:MAG: ABC transporter permease subunit, partial [Spirochaetales bacterium]|nr:ABC transporter permease subunit [Spirochaetales bacterium]